MSHRVGTKRTHENANSVQIGLSSSKETCVRKRIPLRNRRQEGILRVVSRRSFHFHAKGLARFTVTSSGLSCMIIDTLLSSECICLTKKKKKKLKSRVTLESLLNDYFSSEHEQKSTIAMWKFRHCPKWSLWVKQRSSPSFRLSTFRMERSWNSTFSQGGWNVKDFSGDTDDCAWDSTYLCIYLFSICEVNWFKVRQESSGQSNIPS